MKRHLRDGRVERSGTSDSSEVKYKASILIIIFGIITLVGIIFSPIPFIGGVIAWLVWVIGFILWIVLIVMAAQGKKYMLPWAGKLAEKWAG